MRNAVLFHGTTANPVARFYRDYERAILGTLSIGGFFVLWEAAARVGAVSTYFLGSPSGVIGAAVSEVQLPRFWRDAGFAVGALLAGLIADRLGMPAAIWTVAALTGASGFVVLIRMYETHPRQQRGAP